MSDDSQQQTNKAEARQLIRRFTPPWQRQLVIIGAIVVLYLPTRILLDVVRASGEMHVHTLYGDRWPLRLLRYAVNGILIGVLSIQFARWLTFRRWAKGQGID